MTEIQHKAGVHLDLLTSKAVTQTLLEQFCNCLLCMAGLKANSAGCPHYLLLEVTPGVQFFVNLQDALHFRAHAYLQSQWASPCCAWLLFHVSIILEVSSQD